MAKTKPIGVRYDGELLGELKQRGVETAQKALILYEAAYKKEMGGTWAIGAKLIDAAKGRDTAQPPDIELTFMSVLEFAKGGASRKEVEAAIEAKKTFTAAQQDLIRRKIKDSI